MTSPTFVTSAYPLSTLQTYVQRPSAVTKCFISDVHALRACVPADAQGISYIGRDVYVLDQWPCRNVELVAWVVGVDHKEKTMALTLDDGDGVHVLPVTVYLSQHVLPVEPKPDTATRSGPSNHASSSSTAQADARFASARDCKAQRKAAVEASMRGRTKEQIKVYLSKDIRVGDTVRVVGRINEWPRQRHGGQKEWVREVVVDEGSGGSVDVVHEDDQYAHTALVQSLHESLYSKPFVLPPLPSTVAPTTAKSFSIDAIFSTLSSPPQTLSDLPSSEMSEYGIESDELKLRDPAKLRSTQLTEATYRQYLLDYMTQEVVRILADNSHAIEAFPEYDEYGGPTAGKQTPASRRTTPGPTRFPQRDHALHDKTNSYTSTSLTGDVEEQHMSCGAPSSSSRDLLGFSIADLLDVPTLNNLAYRIVEYTARQEEKRRLRRIKANEARPADLALDRKRKAEGRDWRLTEPERQARMERLTAYTIRGLHADGSVVHLQDGYLPLPPEMVLRLLVPHFEREMWLRKAAFMRKDDPRRGNGALVEDLVKRLREWGTDGRWERVGEWVVLDAIRWGEERGWVRKEGKGWWVVEGALEGR